MSQAQVIPKRKKKFTGGNASKRHRDRVNVEFNNLAKLLPFPENVIAKLDKSSILRLAVSYIRAKSFFKDTLALKNLTNTMRGKARLTEQEKFLTEEIFEGNGLVAEIFLQALDGFLIVVTEDMKVLYVSDSVRDYLGYCQAGIIHESLLQFVHSSDHEIIRDGLTLANEVVASYDSDSDKGSNISTGGEADDVVVKQEDSDNSSCDSTKSKDEYYSEMSVKRRRFVCRMKCALSCSSRFYTAFRSFQFAGHVRKSKIKIGKEKKTVNTLIAFCTPTGNSKYDAIDVVSEGVDDMKAQDIEDGDELPDGLPKMTGLHIEPRLRPHVAPIPVTQNETDRRPNGQAFSLLQGANKESYRRPGGPYKDPEYLGGAGWPRLNGHPPYPELFRPTLHDFNSESIHRSPTWNRKSPSSSGRSTPDSDCSKGIKRPHGERNSSPDFLPPKYAKLYDTSHYMFTMQKPVIFDDINRGAHLLLQLAKSRKPYAHPMPCNGNGIHMESQPRNGELAALANRLNGCLPAVISNGFSDPRIRDYSVIRSTRPEGESTGSSPSSPKKDERKSFHISNILGLEDDSRKRNESKDTDAVPIKRCRPEGIHSPCSSDRKSPASCSNSPIQHFSNEERRSPSYFSRRLIKSSSAPGMLQTTQQIKEEEHHVSKECSKFERRNGEHLQRSPKHETEIQESDRKLTVSKDMSSIDDIKHSFAKILSGLTSTITSNLDKTIDTVFQNSAECRSHDRTIPEKKVLTPDCATNASIDRKNTHRVILKGMS